MDDVSGFVMSSYRCTGSYVKFRYVLILLLMTSSIGGSVRFRVFGCDGIGVGMSGSNRCVEDDSCSGWY